MEILMTAMPPVKQKPKLERRVKHKNGLHSVASSTLATPSCALGRSLIWDLLPNDQFRVWRSVADCCGSKWLVDSLFRHR